MANLTFFISLNFVKRFLSDTFLLSNMFKRNISRAFGLTYLNCEPVSNTFQIKSEYFHPSNRFAYEQFVAKQNYFYTVTQNYYFDNFFPYFLVVLEQFL